MQTSENRVLAMHPDLALLENENRREIRCLLIRDVPDAQVDALAGYGAFCVYRQGNLAALLYDKDGCKDEQALRDAVLASGIQAGVSGPFALAASARGCMAKARLALETGLLVNPGQAIYPMDEYGEAALLGAVKQALLEQEFIAEDFCDASLMQMAHMDAQRDTQYVQSLHAYLKCGMDMKTAAKELGVHRNTLSYRLERAAALFDLDLKDGSRCFELLFSLWLAEKLQGETAQHDEALPFDVQAAQGALWSHVERGGQEQTDIGAYGCALLCVDVSRLADAERAALIARVRACMPKESALAYDEDVLLCAVAPERLSLLAERVKPVCAASSCRVVRSQAFPGGRLAQHARLCRMALCAAGGMEVHTRDLCSTLLFMAVECSVSLAPYVSEEVIRVMDDDAQKGTALSRSLYAYLLHFSDMKLAAAQLGMHRNTMEYHLRKIDALIGADKARDRRFMMMCTYKMLALPEIRRYGL